MAKWRKRFMRKSFIFLALLLILALFPQVAASAAVLRASPTTVYLNEPVRFDGSGSDPAVGNIVKYYFDYGDNLSSGWIDSSVVKHQYRQPGTYYARLRIKDEYDYKYTLESNWSAPPVTITVKSQLSVVNVTVPNVVDLNIDEAKEVLAKAGLQLGVVIEKDSDQSPGTVLDQDPKARTMVPVDSAVDLVVAATETQQPLTLGLVADRGEISVGGERSTITVTLLRGGEEVKAPSDTRVLLDTTLGKITPESIIILEGETRGTVVLESSSENGTAEITATSEGLTPGYVEIAVIRPSEEGVTPIRRLVLESDVSSLPSDSESTSTITVTLADDEGNPVAAEEDVTVYLKAMGGQVEPALVTIRGGESFATATFIGPEESGVVRIFASSDGFEGAMVEMEIYPLSEEHYNWGGVIALLLGVAAGLSVLTFFRKKGYFKVEVKPRVGEQKLSLDEEKPLFKEPRAVNEVSSEALEENAALLFSQRELDILADKALDGLQDTRGFRLANFFAGPNRIDNDETRDELKEFFRIDVFELLINGWKKVRALQDFRDCEKYPCENTYQLILLTREMRSTCDLSLDVLLNGIRVLKVPFELDIELNTAGFKMWIRCGRIVRLFSGSMEGTFTVKTGAFKVLEKDMGDLKIPGEVSFEGGIEIPDMFFVSPPW